MNKKLIIGLLAILSIASLCGGYAFLNNNINYQNVKLSETCSMDMPISDNISNYTTGDAIKIYNDTKNNVFIAHFNSQSNGLFSTIEDATQLAAMRDSYKIQSEKISINNTDVWYNKNIGYYMTFIGNNNTHDNILIVTKNKELLTHMINSIKFNKNNKTNNTQQKIINNNYDINIENINDDSDHENLPYPEEDEYVEPEDNYYD